MGRGPAAPKAGSLPHQTPETIDDAPPSEDNHHHEPVEDNNLQIVLQTPSPATNDHHQPQSFPPHAFPPPQEHHHHHQQPHAFPPPQDHQPHAFPPPQDHQPHAFPPAQDPHQGFHAFPPQQHHQAFHQQTTPQFPNTNFVNPGMNQQPGQMPFNPPMVTGVQLPQPLSTQPWKTDLFACMDDPQNAIVTACFPCVTFGQIAEIIDSGNSSCATSGMMYGCVAFLIAMPCLISCTYRTKMRARYGLMEAPGPDWLVHCFCEWCALCQVYRELQLRGLDPAIGWQGNQARVQMTQVGSMTPPMRQNMME